MDRIRMIELKAEAKKRPADLFDYAIDNDSDPVIIEDMEETPESIKKAKEWLKTKKSTAVRRPGWAHSFYDITVYAVEHYIADDNGEFTEGSNYDTADVEIERFYAVLETEDDDWDWGSYDYEKAKDMLLEQGHGLIAIIEADEEDLDHVCVDTIPYEDIAE